MLRNTFVILFSFMMISFATAQSTSNHGNKFEQIDPLLPSPNEYRNIDGSPGHKYWQQRCDYDISSTLDTDLQRISGSEKITYTNNSPNTLKYLWLQLDENQHSTSNTNQYFDPSSINDIMSEADLRSLDPLRS